MGLSEGSRFLHPQKIAPLLKAPDEGVSYIKMKTTILIILYIFCNMAHAERAMNEMPMYGGSHNPTVAKNKEYSISAAKLGWKYYYDGDLDTAIKRFNQSWMFDRNSKDAYWGFGLIMGRRAIEEDTEINLNESVKYLEKANELSNNDPGILVDLAFSKTLLGNYLKQNKKASYKKYFEEADNLFVKAAQLENKYPLLYFNWSVLKFYEGSYSEAKSKLKLAKNLGYTPDPNYEKELNGKLKK